MNESLTIEIAIILLLLVKARTMLLLLLLLLLLLIRLLLITGIGHRLSSMGINNWQIFLNPNLYARAFSQTAGEFVFIYSHDCRFLVWTLYNRRSDTRAFVLLFQTGLSDGGFLFGRSRGCARNALFFPIEGGGSFGFVLFNGFGRWGYIITDWNRGLDVFPYTSFVPIEIDLK